MLFAQLLAKVREKSPNWIPPFKLLGIDPGETTGLAFAVNGDITNYTQATTKEQPEKAILRVLEDWQPTYIVCENYMVYGYKTEAHSWSMLHTPKLIGAISMWAAMHNVPMHLQMAATAKPFCTNAKLKEWGLWIPGQRHADDAIRHVCYFLLFHKETRDGTGATTIPDRRY